MVDVAVVGASGYSALELIKILLRHPQVNITALTSRQDDSPSIASVHPALAGRIDRNCEPFDPDRLAATTQCAFLCLPHGASIQAAAALLERKLRVIDLSADYRLRDPAVYAHWYGEKHADEANLAHAVYGLTELFADQIASARLIANPGCYPTSAILGLAPLLAVGTIETTGIIIDSKSGVSGAGRTPTLMTHFPECNESVEAYNVGRHRHTPEIEQLLSTIARRPVRVVFTPHLIPMDRGIFTTIYAQPKSPGTDAELLEQFRDYYRGKPFVRVVDHLPATKDTAGSNFCDMTARRVGDHVVVLVCLDNLIKGAAGAAVQNFNVLFGFPPETALF